LIKIYGKKKSHILRTNIRAEDKIKKKMMGEIELQILVWWMEGKDPQICNLIGNE
jgi:hypothetical protein